mgnify:CR=1 FL=1
MTSHVRNRGLVAAHAEGPRDLSAFMNQIADGVEGMKRRNTERFDDLQNQIADLATRATSRGLGGGEPGEQAGLTQARAALAEFARTGVVNDIRAAMSVGSDPDGGFTVDTVLSNQINVIAKSISPMARLAQRVTIQSGDSFTQLIDVSDITATWVGEKESRPSTDTPTLQELEIPLLESYVNQPITQRLLDDSNFDISTWLMSKIAEKFAQANGNAFINGNGIKKPKGLLAYDTVADASYECGKIGYVATGVAADIADRPPTVAQPLTTFLLSLRLNYRLSPVCMHHV